MTKKVVNVDGPQSEQAPNISKIPPDTTQYDNIGNTSIIFFFFCFVLFFYQTTLFRFK